MNSKAKARKAMMLPNNESVLSNVSLDREERYQTRFLEQFISSPPLHYVRPSVAGKTLDDYCDIRVMSSNEKSKPLIVVGARGVGRSSLLANFVVQRADKNYNENGKKRAELVFYHHAGCSKAALEVKNFLWRACVAMRDFFGLSRKLQYDETFLSWEFPRTLVRFQIDFFTYILFHRKFCT